MKPLSILTLIVAILATACVPSLNPLYTEEDLTFEPMLIGTWMEKDTAETWSFSQCDKLEYTLVHTDSDGRKGQFSARLVKAGDQLFLDIIPVRPGFTQNDFYKGHFFATHTFVHVVSKEPPVQIAYIEPRWLKDYLTDNPAAIRHQKINGEIMLTGSAKETQKFLLYNLSTRDAFSKPIELARVRGGK